MEHHELNIGDEFKTETGTWRVTDKGTRVIIAIRIDNQDPLNLVGVPYSVEEVVFDEHSIEGILD